MQHKTKMSVPSKSFPTAYPQEKEIIVGLGIIGYLKALFIHLSGRRVRVTAHERYEDGTKTITSNMYPSLTPDEIMSVVPVGPAFTEALSKKFDQPGGIDSGIPGVNDSVAALAFIDQVLKYSEDLAGHKERQRSLLELGKLSMDLWQKLYELGDDRLKKILKDANFHPCRELGADEETVFQNGYRIDIMFNDDKAKEKIQGMINDYQNIGYSRTTSLTPEETLALDPYLEDFIAQQTVKDVHGKLQWKDNAGAILRPGGCINTKKLLPELQKYLTDVMGTYTNEEGVTKNCFTVKYSSEVTGVTSAQSNQQNLIDGLIIKSEADVHRNHHQYKNTHYLFTPGEAVGTLSKLGFKNVVSDAGFAGASLSLTIKIPQELQAEYKNFCQYQEVHQKGIVLAWQANYDEKLQAVVIGVAGTKTFHDQLRPDVNGEFARNRNLVQAQIIYGVIPKLLDLVLPEQTNRTTIKIEDLEYLEKTGVAKRWVGVRSAADDGYLTNGYLSNENGEYGNATTITNLGSGGVSFGPAAVAVEEIIRAQKHKDRFFQPSALTKMAQENKALVDKVSTFAKPTRCY